MKLRPPEGLSGEQRIIITFAAVENSNKKLIFLPIDPIMNEPKKVMLNFC